MKLVSFKMDTGYPSKRNVYAASSGQCVVKYSTKLTHNQFSNQVSKLIRGKLKGKGVKLSNIVGQQQLSVRGAYPKIVRVEFLVITTNKKMDEIGISDMRGMKLWVASP